LKVPPVWIFIFVFVVLTISTIAIYSHNEAYSQALPVGTINTNSLNETGLTLPLLNMDYPSYWKKIENTNNDTILLLSPVDSVAILIQSIPRNEKSLDELTLNSINFIKNNLTNSQILEISNVDPSKGEEQEQSLMFTYGSNDSAIKVLQLWKSNEDRIYVFSYYSENNIFDRFIPVASEIYKSMKISANTHERGDISNEPVRIGGISKNNNMPYVNFSDPVTTTSSNTSSAMNSDNMVVYQNQNSGFMLQYPDYFEKSEKINLVNFIYQDGRASVTVGNIPSGENSMEIFGETRLDQLDRNLNKFTVLNASQSILFGFPTQMIFYEYFDNAGIQKFEGMELWKKDGNEVHIFTFFSETEIFNDLLPVVGNMIDSVRWNEYNWDE